MVCLHRNETLIFYPPVRSNDTCPVLTSVYALLNRGISTTCHYLKYNIGPLLSSLVIWILSPQLITSTNSRAFEISRSRIPELSNIPRFKEQVCDTKDTR